MLGPEELTLLSAVALLFMGLVLPLRGFFRLGAMRALERRRQSATIPTICLAVLVTVFLLNLARDGMPRCSRATAWSSTRSGLGS